MNPFWGASLKQMIKVIDTLKDNFDEIEKV